MIEAYSELGFVKFSSEIPPNLVAIKGSFSIPAAFDFTHPVYGNDFFYPRSTPNDEGKNFEYFDLKFLSSNLFAPLIFIRPEVGRWLTYTGYSKVLRPGNLADFTFSFRGELGTQVSYKIVDKTAIPAPKPAHGIEVNNSQGQTVFHSGLDILSIVSSQTYLTEGQTISGYPVSTFTTNPIVSYDDGNLFFLGEHLRIADHNNIEAGGNFRYNRAIAVRVNSLTSYSVRMMDVFFDEGHADFNSAAYGRPRIIYRCR